MKQSGLSIAKVLRDFCLNLVETEFFNKVGDFISEFEKSQLRLLQISLIAPRSGATRDCAIALSRVT